MSRIFIGLVGLILLIISLWVLVMTCLAGMIWGG